MTNDEMVELSKRFHDTDDLYQLNWLKEYLEARINRVKSTENTRCNCGGVYCPSCWTHY